MRKTIKALIRLMQQQIYDEMALNFRALGNGGRRYTRPQKDYAIDQIDQYGVRATARILEMPRRTLQRWCRKYNVYVRRCPSWVYDWAAKRRKRRTFWERKGYLCRQLKRG